MSGKANTKMEDEDCKGSSFMDKTKLMEDEDCKGSSFMDKTKLPGFRFFPTDEELVGFYLRRKVEKKPLKIQLIKQIDVYEYDPWDLPKASNVAGDEEGYFFCMRSRKYRNSKRPNRVTGSGFWKATGIDKPIYTSQEPHECIGLKKSLVYYLGSAGKGNKTDWMMHEYRLPNGNNDGDHLDAQNRNTEEEAALKKWEEVWTLCRIFKRTPSYRRYVPEMKNVTSFKKSPDDSSSKACSWESEHGERCLRFGDSSEEKNNEEKPWLIGNNQSQSRNTDSFHQQSTAVTPTFPTIWKFNNGDDVLFNGNWDELTSLFE